ncbi:hypothetical protein EVAR_23262_1 [Eumeta japonica]|uniref:Uncharacterized protein n=1 Tax=Eumeta variegata TaxID=151549 RepID=A0A4C1V6A3_EUMVA|nr:hypothetical protein EVAR_23262_1 [Eumeta japonica]
MTAPTSHRHDGRPSREEEIQRVFDVLPEWLDKWKIAVIIGRTTALLTGRQRIMSAQLRRSRCGVENLHPISERTELKAEPHRDIEQDRNQVLDGDKIEDKERNHIIHQSIYDAAAGIFLRNTGETDSSKDVRVP